MAFAEDTFSLRCVGDIAYLCPACIASGEAARKYDGSFQDDFSVDDGVDDPEKLDELIHRTPGYSGWQQEYWRAHCGDYCAYLGHVGARELRALGVLEEVQTLKRCNSASLRLLPHRRSRPLCHTFRAFRHKQDSTLVAEQTAISSIFAFFVSIYSVFVERPG